MDCYAVDRTLFVVGAFGVKTIQGFKFKGAFRADNASKVNSSGGNRDLCAVKVGGGNGAAASLRNSSPRALRAST